MESKLHPTMAHRKKRQHEDLINESKRIGTVYRKTREKSDWEPLMSQEEASEIPVTKT